MTEAIRAEEYAGKAAGHAVDVWLNQFWTETTGSTDRAFAILSGAILDQVLGILLAALAIDEELLTTRLLSPERALGSFGSKIDVCYVFGLISEREWRALAAVQKIRNAFAHKLGNLSFEDPSMKDRARAIAGELSLKATRDGDGRELFQAGVSVLWMSLVGKIGLVRRAARMPHDPSSAMTMHYATGGSHSR